MRTRTIVKTALITAAAAGAALATAGMAAGTASASIYHGHPWLTPMTGLHSYEAEITSMTQWQHAEPYALTDGGRTPALRQLPANSPQPGQVYAHNQEFTELHNSSVTELAFGQRVHGGYEVLTQQGGRLVFEPLNRRGATADQLWTWKAGKSADSWSFQNVGTGMYLTAFHQGRFGNGGSGNNWFGDGEVGIGSQPFIWQQVELPAAA